MHDAVQLCAWGFSCCEAMNLDQLLSWLKTAPEGTEFSVTVRFPDGIDRRIDPATCRDEPTPAPSTPEDVGQGRDAVSKGPPKRKPSPPKQCAEEGCQGKAASR